MKRLLHTALAASLGALGLAAAAALAQPAPLRAAGAGSDDIPLADYLGLLTQIAPAAHDGAQAYLRAFEQRCGRSLTTAGLRRAMSDGDGDPVLMAMIRASQLRDANALARLAHEFACERRGTP